MSSLTQCTEVLLSFLISFLPFFLQQLLIIVESHCLAVFFALGMLQWKSNFWPMEMEEKEWEGWEEEEGGGRGRGKLIGCVVNNKCINYMGFPGGASGKESTCQCRRCRRPRFHPWVGHGNLHPGGGHGNPLQYSCLWNSVGRGAWQAAVHGATKGQTRLSDHSFSDHDRCDTGKWSTEEQPKAEKAVLSNVVVVGYIEGFWANASKSKWWMLLRRGFPSKGTAAEALSWTVPQATMAYGARRKRSEYTFC